MSSTPAQWVGQATDQIFFFFGGGESQRYAPLGKISYQGPAGACDGHTGHNGYTCDGHTACDGHMDTMVTLVMVTLHVMVTWSQWSHL